MRRSGGGRGAAVVRVAVLWVGVMGVGFIFVGGFDFNPTRGSGGGGGV